MRLILIRHGQAEASSADGSDFRRALTPAGRERLENTYPSLARYLNAKSSCEVWTSPKTRALQTAEVLCRYMPDVSPEIKPFLENGDLDAFADAIRSHKHGDTLVIVGHEPYLSDWVRAMTGLDVHFKKGCGEMLYLPPHAPERAIRIAGIDFDQMKTLDLFSVPVGVGIATLIERQHKQIVKARDTFLDDPDDSDALSALRVALRSQYALLEFIEPYCSQKPFRKAERLYLSLYDDLEELRAIIVYTGVSDAKMEEGSLRCDVNISLRPVGEEKFGTRAEIKNLNSFRAVERAIEYEIERQTELLEDGEKVRLETRTWDDAQGMTFSLRSKEEADEYRYFPEPDLPPIVLTDEWIQGMKESLPELPRARRARLAADGIGPKEAAIITQDIALADFYDAAKALIDEPQMISNWLVGDVQAKLNASGKTLAESGFTPERLVQLLTRIKSGDISGKIAKDVFMKAFDENRDPAAIIEEEGLQQISDTDSLAPMIQEIIDSNPKSVADYKAGKKKALGFFVGQVMKGTKGQANPGVVNQMIVELLEKM